MSFEEIVSLLGRMAETSRYTIGLFALTLLFAIPLGLPLTMGRVSRIAPVRWLSQAYLLVVRGTPLMLQLILLFYGLPLPSWGLSRFQVAVVAFSLNYAAYFAEIYRSGLESIPAGQYEAANVLGFSKVQTFFHIVLPQIVKKILPTMGNEFITLVKDTSLAMIIGVVEISGLAQKEQARAVTIVPVIIAGVFYLLMNAVVSGCMHAAEKKLSYYR